MGYRYLEDGGGEHVVGAGRLQLTCKIAGPVPVPAALPQVAWRRGLDLAPLDLRDDGDVRWLESLVWPGEADRAEQLRAAVEIFRSEPSPVVPGDLLHDLARVAKDAPAEATLVVYHSAVLAYVDEAGRRRFREQLTELRQRRPVVWIANEAPGVVVDVAPSDRAGAFVLAQDEVPLAFAAGHGNWLEWFDASLR